MKKTKPLHLLFDMRISFLLYLLFLVSCSTEEEHPDKPYEGSMTIAVDENYSKVMDAQVRIFQNQYPKVKITVEYKNETDCIKDLMDKKVKMIFVTRRLSQNELTVAQQNALAVSYGELARDGIALLSSKSSSIKNLKTEDVKKRLSQEDDQNTSFVFENSNAGNALYFIDSVLQGQPLNKRTYSAGSVDSLLDYVSQSTSAIGVLDMIQVLQPRDQSIRQLLQKLQIIGVKTDTADYYWQPFPLYVASKSYPYVKSLAFVLDESYQGLGHSFANYLSKEQGQLLFHKYDLFPLQYNVVNREVQIIDKDVL